MLGLFKVLVEGKNKCVLRDFLQFCSRIGLRIYVFFFIILGININNLKMVGRVLELCFQVYKLFLIYIEVQVIFFIFYIFIDIVFIGFF